MRVFETLNPDGSTSRVEAENAKAAVAQAQARETEASEQARYQPTAMDYINGLAAAGTEGSIDLLDAIPNVLNQSLLSKRSGLSALAGTDLTLPTIRGEPGDKRREYFDREFSNAENLSDSPIYARSRDAARMGTQGLMTLMLPFTRAAGLRAAATAETGAVLGGLTGGQAAATMFGEDSRSTGEILGAISPSAAEGVWGAAKNLPGVRSADRAVAARLERELSPEDMATARRNVTRGDTGTLADLTNSPRAYEIETAQARHSFPLRESIRKVETGIQDDVARGIQGLEPDASPVAAVGGVAERVQAAKGRVLERSQAANRQVAQTRAAATAERQLAEEASQRATQLTDTAEGVAPALRQASLQKATPPGFELPEGPFREQMGALRDKWVTDGFKQVKKQSFDVEGEDVVDAVEQAMEEFAAEPETLGILKAVAARMEGKVPVSGADLMALRNKLSSRAGELMAADSPLSRMRARTFNQAKGTIDRGIRRGLGEDGARAFDEELASYGAFANLEDSAIKAASGRYGLPGASDMVGGTLNRAPRQSIPAGRVRGLPEAWGAQAEEAALLAKSKAAEAEARQLGQSANALDTAANQRATQATRARTQGVKNIDATRAGKLAKAREAETLVGNLGKDLSGPNPVAAVQETLRVGERSGGAAGLRRGYLDRLSDMIRKNPEKADAILQREGRILQEAGAITPEELAGLATTVSPLKSIATRKAASPRALPLANAAAIEGAATAAGTAAAAMAPVHALIVSGRVRNMTSKVLKNISIGAQEKALDKILADPKAFLAATDNLAKVADPVKLRSGLATAMGLTLAELGDTD